jgi:hypothetical protein
MTDFAIGRWLQFPRYRKSGILEMRLRPGSRMNIGEGLDKRFGFVFLWQSTSKEIYWRTGFFSG